MAKKTIKVHRDARNGQFVTPDTVKKRPGSTVTETRPAPKPPKKR